MVALPVVFLIVISSNYRDGNGPAPVQLLPNKAREEVLKHEPLKDMESRANDLSLSDLQVLITDSTTRKTEPVAKQYVDEPNLKEEEPIQKQSPMPLYSLVKNVCEEGYIMDQNGVCQKAVVLKGEKEFDSERKRRRRRYIEDAEMVGHKNLKPFFYHLDTASHYRKLLEKPKGNERIDCGKIHSGLEEDGAGGCRKSNSLEVSNKLRFSPKWRLAANT